MNATNHWEGKAGKTRLNCFRLLAGRGQAGATRNEMLARRDLYGLAFRNRISELVDMGCIFRDWRHTLGKQLGHWEGNDYRYILESWPESLNQYLKDSPSAAAIVPDRMPSHKQIRRHDNARWFEEQFGAHNQTTKSVPVVGDDALPLFAEVSK